LRVVKAFFSEIYYIESKVIRVQSMKTHKGSRGTAPLFPNLHLDGSEWAVSRPGHFTPENEPWYPLNRRLGEYNSQFGRFGEQKALFTLWDSNIGLSLSLTGLVFKF
jgi:hypothetical protein